MFFVNTKKVWLIKMASYPNDVVRNGQGQFAKLTSSTSQPSIKKNRNESTRVPTWTTKEASHVWR